VDILVPLGLGLLEWVPAAPVGPPLSASDQTVAVR